MGTRAITKVIAKRDNEDVVILCMYSQFDGYFSGMGKDTSAFLASGLSKERENPSFNHPKLGEPFVDMPDIAAQLVAHFKTNTPGIYIYPSDTEMDNCCAQYEYRIEPRDHGGYDGIILKGRARGSKDWNILFPYTEESKRIMGVVNK